MFFSLAIHPQQPLQDSNIQYRLVGLPTKCSIELVTDNVMNDRCAFDGNQTFTLKPVDG